MPDFPNANPNAPSWRVVGMMERELQRQASEGLLTFAGNPDRMGRLEVHGVMDLAALANVVCGALRENFQL